MSPRRPATIARHALLAASAAGTVGLLVAAPGAPADVTLPFLLLALVPLGALVVAEHRNHTTPPLAVIGLGAGLLMLAVAQPPRGSHDLWSYAAYGRLVSDHHASPYTHRPSELGPADPILARVAPAWRSTRSVYGPGFTLLSAAIMAVNRSHPLPTRLAFQGLAAAAVLSAAALLARRRVGTAALAAFVLNPIIVVAVVNGGHNDALVGLAVLSSCLALERRRGVVAGALMAAAILVKVVAVLPALAALVWIARHQGRRAATSFAAATAMPVAAGYGAFGLRATLAPVLAAGAHTSRVSIWEPMASSHRSVLAAALVVAFTAAIVVARLHKGSAAPALVAACAGYLLVAAYVLPWYFAWVLPLAALDPEPVLPRLLLAQTAVTLLAYQYRATRRPDALDHLLRDGDALARLFVLTAAAVLAVAALRRTRARARVPARA